jgi:hypothetical protein
MKRTILFVLTSLIALAADDGWTKVREIKSGTEIRVYRRGVKQPILAKFDEANDESLVVATKTEQVAIAKDQIDRVDYRPPKTGSRVSRESKTTTEIDTKTSSSTVPHNAPGPTTSSSSSLNIGGKPDFETVYRRTSVPPVK